jgi:hypothetical protein
MKHSNAEMPAAVIPFLLSIREFPQTLQAPPTLERTVVIAAPIKPPAIANGNVVHGPGRVRLT